MKKHKLEIKIDHNFKKLHVGSCTEAGDVVDLGRDRDNVAEVLSRRYWEYKVLDYEEKVIDGFYDVTSISSPVQGKMPSLTDLESEHRGSDFEAVIVNRTVDSALEELVRVAQHLAKGAAVRILVERLADLVAGHMGGPVKDANIMLEKWMERSTELRTSHHTMLLPIGALNIGLSRHRALLFKVLADNVKLPCRLVKGSHYTGVEEDAVNIIKLDNERREFLVDLMEVPGTLIPAHILSAKDTSFKSYNPNISKTPSLHSTIDLSLLYTRSQPLPGEGNRQISSEDSFQPDRFSCSVKAESSFSFSDANRNPGVGSSGVSKGVIDPNQIDIASSSTVGISLHMGNCGNLSAGDRVWMNVNIAPKSQNRPEDSKKLSPEDSKKLSSDPKPFQIRDTGKGFMPNKPAGNSNELQQQNDSLIPDRPLVARWKSRHDINVVPTRKEYDYMESHFTKNMHEKYSADTSNLGNSSKFVIKKQENKGIQLQDQRELKNERDVQATSKLKDPECPNSSVDSRRNRTGNILDDADFVECEIPWEHLDIRENIGQGSYGEVYRASWNGREVAVKMLVDQNISGAALDKFKREVRIMQTLHHPNVVLFIGAVTRPPYLSIVTEFLPRGNLYEILHHSGRRIDEKLRIKMALDVAMGMNCLHTSTPTIVHGDLKSPNLLVDENWNVKVCDFGLSRFKHKTFLSVKSSSGTAEWMAPELLCNKPSNEKCDVYSFGVILWELATLRMPWSSMNPMQIVGAVGFGNQRLEIPKEVDPVVAKIILGCWQTEPYLRPSFAHLIEVLEPLQRLIAIPPQEDV